MILEDNQENKVIKEYSLINLEAVDKGESVFIKLTKNVKIFSVALRGNMVEIFVEEDLNEKRYDKEFYITTTGNGLPKNKAYGWRFLDTIRGNAICNYNFYHVFIRVV